MTCEANQTLTNQQCVANTVANCVVHETPFSCKTCEQGYGISSVDGKNKCILLTPIANCIYQSQFEPYLCSQCDTLYYVNAQGTCTALNVDNTVQNCLIYGTDQKCTKCQPKFILALNGKSCIQVNDPIICDQSVEISNNICDLCQAGYKMNDSGVCVETNALKIPGCFVTKINDDNSCAVCSFGYQMNENMQCQLATAVNGGSGSSNNGSTNGSGNNNTKGASILAKALKIFALIFISM